MNKCLIKRKSGISTSLSFIALAIIILVIGSIVAYFYIYHLKLTTQVETSELAKQETRLLEKLSLILWYKSGNKGIAIISNDGEIPVYIKKIYADDNIIDLSSNPIVINPHSKIEAETPYSNGQSLMVETSSGNLIKFVEKGFTITGTTWTGSLPTEITTTSYVPTTITTTQTSISPTTITTTYLTTQTLTSYIPTTYTTTFTTTTPTTITTTTPITYTTTIPTTITQTLTTTTPTTITQTLSTTQTLTSYIPTTYTTTYATTGTATITTTVPTTITTTYSTTQTITSYVPTTYTSIITTTTPTTLTQTQTTTRTLTPSFIISSYTETANLPFSTLYFRGDSGTVNGLSAKMLGTSQGGTAGSISGPDTTDYYHTAVFGIRVWKRSSSGIEIEITNQQPVGIVVVNYANNPAGVYPVAVDFPPISLSPTDSIVIRVYTKLLGDTTWSERGTWTTNQLGINKFPSSEWTIYYDLTKGQQYIYPRTHYWWIFNFGSEKNSRIAFIRLNIAPTTITTYYLIFIGEGSQIFLITLCIIAVSITIEIRGRVKNEKYEE